MEGRKKELGFEIQDGDGGRGGKFWMCTTYAVMYIVLVVG